MLVLGMAKIKGSNKIKKMQSIQGELQLFIIIETIQHYKVLREMEQKLI